jgi:YbbR domain-containing protein
MIKNITEIPGDFEIRKLRNNKRVVVFLICLFISTVLWFLNALSKNYNTIISYPVKFVNPPENRFLGGTPLSTLQLSVEGKGFILLQHKLLTFSPIELDISEMIKNSVPVSGIYNIPAQNLRNSVSDEISSDLDIFVIRPEMIEIILDSLTTKNVPVEIDLDVEFASQMHLKNKVVTNPDMVEISGPAIILEKMSSVKTKVNIVNQLQNSIDQEIELIHPEKTTIVPEKVMIHIEVEKYTEKELSVPIEILNKPPGVDLKLFPSEIKLLCNVGLSRFDKIKSSDFGIAVDYKSITADVNSLLITIYKQPEFIQNIRLNPERVEFLIETD